MEKGFLDKVEDKGYVLKFWDFTRISVTQNNLQELKEIWDQWNDETKYLFYRDYGRLGAHHRRVHNSTSLPEDSSLQSLF
ncbi:hypothetical protein Golob_004053 [Gossypium lobatum]|uniref:Uncharacterized protein n=1 Tax=Gossypium lobatum TaxID=34289 RepID=A0A7J8N080_9ROSI|nr:hypothetical protein [Gossypium lobatum]